MASSLTVYFFNPQLPPRDSYICCINGVHITNLPCVFSRLLYMRNKTKQFHFRRGFCCVNGDQTAPDFSNCQKYTANTEGEENASSGQTPLSSKEMVEKLRRYGVAGILSYGLLNTAYYLFTFLLVWFYVVPAPGKIGYLAAVKRFFKLLAMVWAGSQVTKLIRAAGALALAPFVDKGLSWFTVKFKFQSQGKASMVIVGCCFGLAIALFLVVTLLSA